MYISYPSIINILDNLDVITKVCSHLDYIPDIWTLDHNVATDESRNTCISKAYLYQFPFSVVLYVLYQ